MRPQSAFRGLMTGSALIATLSLLSANPVQAENDGEKRLVQGVKKTLLLFPYDQGTLNTQNASEVLSLLVDSTRSRLTISNSYLVTQYSRAVPSIARAKNDQILTDADTSAPFAEDNRKAAKLGKVGEFEVVFVGSVDDYKYDAAKKQSTITISGRLIDSENEKVLKSVTLTADSGSGGNATEEDRALDAARAAADKALAQLVPIANVQPTNVNSKPTTPKKKRDNMGWLWGVLAVGLGVGIGLSALSGGGGSGGDNNPPPPP